MSSSKALTRKAQPPLDALRIAFLSFESVAKEADESGGDPVLEIALDALRDRSAALKQKSDDVHREVFHTR